MANAFNLTAQLNLRGPSNLKPVIKNIKSQLGNINANVNLTVAKNSSTNIGKLNAGLKALNKTLITTGVNSRNAAKAISSLGTAINGINANQVSTSINKATQASAQLASKQQSVSKSLASSRTEMEEFGKQSGLAIRRFAAFSAVTAVVFKLNTAITSGVSSFIEFEKQFIRLQQVTGDSAQSLSRLQTSITKLSTGLGVTSQELSQVSVTLAQAGLNARETEKALEALALSALAPSFDNLNNTVEGSIALMKQFGISSNELGSALGSINAVAASFAVEAGDIIKAISRTGGVFANASKGVSEGTDALNEFIAVFTSVRATTRESAETIATGLRTIFTRIQRGSTIEALKEFGVTLTDLEGKFVGPFKAIQLLSEGLGKLDPRDISFSNIVEELGGFRQIGKVIPLIQQFSTAQRALGIANAGQGSLAEDAAIAQLSLANQIAKVREEFLGLFREIGGSDSFQTIAKGALGLASALIKIADSVKGVLPVLAIMGAAKGLSAVTQFTSGFAGGIKSGGGARGFGSRMSGAPSGFATGGLVPGQGNRDTVPAMLTPGEFVIRKKAVETIGASKLGSMNKYAGGGKVQKFAKAGEVKKARASKVANVDYVETYDGDSITIDYTPSSEAYQTSTRLVGFDAYELNRGTATEREKGAQAKAITETWAKGQSKQALYDKFASASGQKDKYGRPMFNAPRLGSRLVQAGVAVPYTGSGKKATKNMGGYIQKFENGGEIKVAKTGKVTKAAIEGATTSQIQSLLTNPNVRKNPASMAALNKALEKKQLQEATLPKFAVIGLRGTPFNEKVKAPTSKKAVNIMGSVLPAGIADSYEGQMADGFIKTVKGISGQIAGKVGAGVVPDKELKSIMTETGFYNAVGAYLETAVAGVGAPFLKSSANEPIDFPAGVGNVGSLFGVPGNIPTDTTRTVGDIKGLRGKDKSKFLGQVDRYIEKYGTTETLKLAAGGSVADTVPALLTPGEFVINKKAAKNIGSAQLNKMNKADKLQGFNKGGPVGFADGGGVPLRPDRIRSSTVAIPDSGKEELQKLVAVLEQLGMQSSKTSEIVANQGRVSYRTAIEAGKADVDRLKAAGATSAQIAEAEKALMSVRDQAAQNLKTRKNAEKTFGATGKDSAAVQGRIAAEAERMAEQKINNIRQSRKNANEDLTAEDIAKARDSAFSAATRKVTGVSSADLKASGLSGSDLQQYVSGTQLDLKSQSKFFKQFEATRRQQLRQAGKSAAEAKKLAKQEVKARRDITKQMQKSRGLPTGGGMLGKLKGGIGSQGSIAASLALPMITDFFAGGEPTSASGAANQAAVQGGASALSTGLAVSSIAGPIAGVAAGAVSMVKAFADARNAANEFADKLSQTRIEESVEKLKAAFDDLSKNAENQRDLQIIGQELRNITTETQKLAQNNLTQTQFGLLNIPDMFSQDQDRSFQRGEVLNNQGVLPYLQSLFSEDALEDNFDKEQPRLARENAKLFVEAAASTRQYVQSLVNAGSTFKELTTDANLKDFAKNIALADLSVQQAIQNMSAIDAANFVNEVAEAELRKQIKISINTKALADLNKVAKELSISFKRLFSSMDQSLSRAAFSLEKFDKNLELTINSLSGSAKIGQSSLEDANILANPLASSDEDFTRATGRAAARFGDDSGLIKGLLQLGPNLEDSLLKTINSVLSTAGDNPEIAKGRVNRAVQEELKNLGLPASLTAKLSREIAKAVGEITNETDKGSVSLQELTEKISGLNDLIGTSAQARKTAINALNQWQSSLNSYASAINKMTEIQLESANRLRRAAGILFDAQVNLAGALGQDISLDTLEKERDRDIRSRTGGINDPADIANSLRQLETRRQSQQANLNAVGNDINAPDASAAVIKTTQELSKTNFQISETRAALESLANNSNLASSALNKIQKAQQDQAGKVGFIEKLVTSTPEQLKTLNNSFADLQRYISGQAVSIQQSTAAQKAYRKALRSGASPRDAQKEAQKAFADQRGNALSLLKEISPFLGDNQQSNNLRAGALETMLRESGVGMNPMLSDVLDSLRNPTLDPATAKAIATYEKAIGIQAQANTQLSILNTDLAGKIAKDSASAIKEALEGVTLKFDQQQIQDIVDGIRTAGRQPDTKAAGGIIYASQGAAVDFAPQGTDTVPAMLTPGEFVINRSATQKHRPILEAINNGYSKGGSVSYYAAGGYVAGSAAAADDIWKYDSNKKPVTNTDLYTKFPDKKILSGYNDLSVGHKITGGKAEFGNNNDVNLSAPPGLTNKALNATNDKLLPQPLDFTTKAFTTAAGNGVLTGADMYFTNTSGGIRSRFDAYSSNIPTTKLDFPFLDYKGLTEEKITKKKLEQLRDRYVKFETNNPGFTKNIKTRGGYKHLTSRSGKKLLISSSPAADYAVDQPQIEAEYTPASGYLGRVETVKIALSKLTTKVSNPDAGLGLFAGNTNPSSYAESLLGYEIDGNSNVAKFGNSLGNRIGSSVFKSAQPTATQYDPDTYIKGVETFRAQKKELDRIFGLDAAVAFTLDDSVDKKTENQLKNLFNSTSPYIRYDFNKDVFKNLNKLGATDEAISVYGGGAAAFETQFGPSIDNLVQNSVIADAQTSMGTGKPISISFPPKSKQFGWTQGISPEKLDTDFTNRQAQAEQEMSQIRGTTKSKLKGFFNLDVPVNGNQQNVKIPYHLSYRKLDGESKLWDPTINGFSGQTMSDVFGGPGYALLPTESNFNPYATFNAGDAINLLATQDAYDSDKIIKPDFVKKQFENADVKKYLGEVLEQGEVEIGSKTAASNLMRTTLSGNNTGAGPLAFFERMNQTYIDPTIDNTGLPTNARTTSFPDYLTNVATELLSQQSASQSKAESQVANPEEFKTNLSSIQYLRPAFETIGKTAFSLFGAGAPYNVGIPFGVNVPANANKDQIKQLSSMLQGQLANYYTYIEDKVAQANFPNLGMYDMYNNAEVLSYGAQSAFGALANSDTNAITRYLKQEDLIKPNFDWQTLKDQTLTMFRAIGGSKRANKFLDGEQGKLSADDKLDLSTIIGDGDDLAAVDAGGGVNRKDKPELNTLRNVMNAAFNPYNRFDEITDRKILINAVKSRFMGATDGPNGRPLFSQQMMQNTLDSMDAIKLWFGGEPGANADIAQPPEEFNADGLPKGVKENQEKKSAETGAGGLGNIGRGIMAAGSFLPGLAGAGFALAGMLPSVASIRTSTWKGIDYLYDKDPATPDYHTRLTELQNGFDQKIYDEAKKGMAELGALFEVGSLPGLDYYKSTGAPKEKPKPAAGFQTGGMIYASQGQLVNFQPQGTDTVPAMLTPGEFVINKQATQKNLPLLKAINSGGAESYGDNGVMYAAEGTKNPVQSAARRRTDAIQRFSKLDKNGNGVLDDGEFSIVSKMYDTNLDGAITLDEWMGFFDKANAKDIRVYRRDQNTRRKKRGSDDYQTQRDRNRNNLKTDKESKSAAYRARQEVLDRGGTYAEANAAGRQAYQDNFELDTTTPSGFEDRIFTPDALKRRKRYQARKEMTPEQRMKDIREEKAENRREEAEKKAAERQRKADIRRTEVVEEQKIKSEAEARQLGVDEKLNTKILGGQADYRGRDKQRLDFDDKGDREIMRKKVIADNYTFKDKTGGFSTTGTIEGVDYDAKMITIGKIDPKTGQPLYDDDGNQRTTTVPLDKLGDKTLQRVTSSDEWKESTPEAAQERMDAASRKINDDIRRKQSIDQQIEDMVAPKREARDAKRSAREGKVFDINTREEISSTSFGDDLLMNQENQLGASLDNTQRNRAISEMLAKEEAGQRAKDEASQVREITTQRQKIKEYLVNDLENKMKELNKDGKATDSRLNHTNEYKEYQKLAGQLDTVKAEGRLGNVVEPLLRTDENISGYKLPQEQIDANIEKNKEIQKRNDLFAFATSTYNDEGLMSPEALSAAANTTGVKQVLGTLEGVTQTAKGTLQMAGGAIGSGIGVGSMISAAYLKRFGLLPEQAQAFIDTFGNSLTEDSIRMLKIGAGNTVGGGITIRESLPEFIGGGDSTDVDSIKIKKATQNLDQQRLDDADDLGVGGAVRFTDLLTELAADASVGDALFSTVFKAGKLTATGLKNLRKSPLILKALEKTGKIPGEIFDLLKKTPGALNDVGKIDIGDTLKRINKVMSNTPAGEAQAARMSALRQQYIKQGVPEGRVDALLQDAIDTQSDLGYRIFQNEGVLPDQDLLELAMNRRDRLMDMGYGDDLAAQLTGTDFIPNNPVSDAKYMEYLNNASPEELTALRKRLTKGQQRNVLGAEAKANQQMNNLKKTTEPVNPTDSDIMNMFPQPQPTAAGDDLLAPATFGDNVSTSTAPKPGTSVSELNRRGITSQTRTSTTQARIGAKAANEAADTAGARLLAKKKLSLESRAGSLAGVPDDEIIRIFDEVQRQGLKNPAAIEAAVQSEVSAIRKGQRASLSTRVNTDLLTDEQVGRIIQESKSVTKKGGQRDAFARQLANDISEGNINSSAFDLADQKIMADYKRLKDAGQDAQAEVLWMNSDIDSLIKNASNEQTAATRARRTQQLQNFPSTAPPQAAPRAPFTAPPKQTQLLQPLGQQIPVSSTTAPTTQTLGVPGGTQIPVNPALSTPKPSVQQGGNVYLPGKGGKPGGLTSQTTKLPGAGGSAVTQAAQTAQATQVTGESTLSKINKVLGYGVEWEDKNITQRIVSRLVNPRRHFKTKAAALGLAGGRMFLYNEDNNVAEAQGGRGDKTITMPVTLAPDPLDPNNQIYVDPTGTPIPVTDAPKKKNRKANGGVIYASNGALIQAQSQGSDTVPAMLTPGEFVMNRIATNQNRPLLESMNSGQFNSGGLVRYMASGGYVQPQRLQEGGGPISGQQVQSAGSGGVNNVSMERPSWVDDVLSAFNSVGPAILEASSSIGSSAQQLASAVPSNGIDINNNVNINGSVGLDSQSIGRAVAMGSQQGQNYADRRIADVQSTLQNGTDGAISVYA